MHNRDWLWYIWGEHGTAQISVDSVVLLSVGTNFWTQGSLPSSRRYGCQLCFQTRFQFQFPRFRWWFWPKVWNGLSLRSHRDSIWKISANPFPKLSLLIWRSAWRVTSIFGGLWEMEEFRSSTVKWWICESLSFLHFLEIPPFQVLLLLPSLLKKHKVWSGCHIRLFVLADRRGSRKKKRGFAEPVATSWILRSSNIKLSMKLNQHQKMFAHKSTHDWRLGSQFRQALENCQGRRWCRSDAARTWHVRRMRPISISTAMNTVNILWISQCINTTITT